VLELKATDITYGPVSPGVFSISPPAGAKVVKVPTPSTAGAGGHERRHGRHGEHAEHAGVTGVASVQRHLKFTLAAPARLAGRSRQTVRLLEMNGRSAALITY